MGGYHPLVEVQHIILSVVTSLQPAMGGVNAAEAAGIGLLLTALVLGIRHGIDWDHIAAITDITSSQESHRDSIVFGTLYALGHALVVFLIGSAAILIGAKLPPSVDPIPPPSEVTEPPEVTPPEPAMVEPVGQPEPDMPDPLMPPPSKVPGMPELLCPRFADEFANQFLSDE